MVPAATTRAMDRLPKQAYERETVRGNMIIELQNLSASALGALISAAEKRLAVLSARRPIAAVRRELAAVAASEGYRITDLFSLERRVRPARKRRVKRATKKVAPKYRDPSNKRLTWTGRGRQPLWLAEKVRRGQSVADFLIPGSARPTPKKGGQVGRKSVFKRT